MTARIDPDLLDDNVLSDILSNMGYENGGNWEDDATADKMIKEVSNLTPFEALDRFLSWNGLIGYTSVILRAVKSIEEATTEVK